MKEILFIVDPLSISYLILILRRNSMATNLSQPHTSYPFFKQIFSKAQQLGKLPCNASLRGQWWCWNLIQVWWTLTCPQLMAKKWWGMGWVRGVNIMRTPTPKLHALFWNLNVFKMTSQHFVSSLTQFHCSPKKHITSPKFQGGLATHLSFLQRMSSTPWSWTSIAWGCREPSNWWKFPGFFGLFFLRGVGHNKQLYIYSIYKKQKYIPHLLYKSIC